MSQEPIRLVGAHEIRLRLTSVSRQRVYQITRRDDFPAPVADLKQGKVWQAKDVDDWIEGHRGSRPGTGADPASGETAAARPVIAQRYGGRG